MDNIVSRFLENGQQRRAWLDGKISNVIDYYTPPHLRQATRFAAEMNPIQGMSDSMSQFGVAMDPNVPSGERWQAGRLAVGGALSGGQNGDRNDKLAEYGF